MSVKHLQELEWQPRRSRGGVRALVIAALLAAGVLALLDWKQDLDARRIDQELRAERAARLASRSAGRPIEPTTSLSAAGMRQINAQIALLNRDWAQLLQMLAPKNDRVRLLATDVNPTTGAIRVDGSADSAAGANAYAESLQKRSRQLTNVRLLLLEREAGTIKFEVTAQWNE
ncbi:hypothetical protein [Lysobacter terrae]